MSRFSTDQNEIMSNFYVRNMLRGDYSRSSKSVGRGAGSLSSSLNEQINTILPLDSTIEKETKNVMFDTDSTSSRVSLIENKKDAAVEASFLDYRCLPNTNIDFAASATNTTGNEYIFCYLTIGMKYKMSILDKMNLVIFLRFISGNQNHAKSYKNVGHDEEAEGISIYNIENSNTQECSENDLSGKCK